MSHELGKYLVNNLELVYPPISNQEGEWLQHDKDARIQVGRSKLYMIGSRPEVVFLDFDLNTSDHSLRFDLALNGTDERVAWHIPLNAMLADYEGEVEIELGDKIIRIWSLVGGEPVEVLHWFTTDKLMYDASRGYPGLTAPVIPDSFTTFDLLYVGISKATDSFTRLFETGHQARLKILSNERQKHATARVTDEMVLFFFGIEPLGIRISSFASPLDDYGADIRPEQRTIVADAEKAFVKLLDPFYNAEKYAQYPRGKDGLYGAGFRRYLYSVAENLTFRTTSIVLHGRVVESGRDVIVVEGDVVTMHSLATTVDQD